MSRVETLITLWLLAQVPLAILLGGSIAQGGAQ